MNFLTDITGGLYDTAKSITGGLASGVQHLASSLGTAVSNIAKNPLPIIETAILMEFGVPAPIASAAVSAANGGNVRDIALAAATSYGAQQIGGYAGNQYSPIEQETLNQLGPQYSNEALIKQIVTSSSGSAAVAALKGQSLDKILAAGASGAVNGYVTQELLSRGYNPKDLDTKLISNAVTSATRAILSGKSVTDAVTQSTAAIALSDAINGGINSLKTNETKGNELVNLYNTKKAEADDYYNNYVKFAVDKESHAIDNYNQTVEYLKNQEGVFSLYNDVYETLDKNAYGGPLVTYATNSDTFKALGYQYAFDSNNNSYWYKIGPDQEIIKATSNSVAQDAVDYLNAHEADATKAIDNYNNAAKNYLPAYKNAVDTYHQYANNSLPKYQQYTDELNNLNSQITDLNTNTENIAKTLGTDVEKYNKQIGDDLAHIIGTDAANQVDANLKKLSGVQVAGTLPTDVFNVDVGGSPIYGGTSRADTVTPPFGYSLLPISEADNKPEGSYYDPTQNAWFMPNQDVKNLQTQLQNGDDGGADSTATTPKLTSQELNLIDAAINSGDFSSLPADLRAKLHTTNTTTVQSGGESGDETGGGGGETGTPGGTTTTTTDDGGGGDSSTTPVDTTPTCAEGYHWNGSMCVSDTDVQDTSTHCPDGYVLDLETQRCVPIEDAGGGTPGGGTTPGGTTPGGTTPGGTTPGGTTPGGTTPGGTTPGKTPGGTTPGGTTPAPTGKPTSNGLDLASLLALLGQQNQQAPAPIPTVDIGSVLDLEAPLEVNPFAKKQTQSKMASGGSIDDLLALLQQRG